MQGPEYSIFIYTKIASLYKYYITCSSVAHSLSVTLARAVGSHLYTSKGSKECQHPGYCHRRWSQYSPAIATNCHYTGETERRHNFYVDTTLCSLLLYLVSYHCCFLRFLHALNLCDRATCPPSRWDFI